MAPGSRRAAGAETPEVDEVEETEAEEAQYTLVEYKGQPPYGVEFLSSHTIEKSSADPSHKSERKSFAGQGIEVPEDLVWSRENGFKVKIRSDLTDLLDALRREPGFKVHE